ncbi:MAG: hypothetical protein KDI75_07120 [Xanthomonadales bacterium]|nr:hypothetical protein [Xanthomonadales bacterium]
MNTMQSTWRKRFGRNQSARRANSLMVAAFIAGLASTAACADTPVSGDIDTNTVWEIDGSPYVISGDVHVINNATLSVKPGVALHFEAGASLGITRGALSAQGSVAAPIVLTSVEDNGSGTPVAGAWGPIKFGGDTRDGETALAHVEVRFGKGIVLEQASPSFNNLRLLNNEGPAISLDLQSSPVGQNLQADGNGINGIVVPSGVIDTDISWTLRGIPYVLEQGKIRIGHLDSQLTPAELELYVSDSGVLELSLADPAPAGGLNFALNSNPAWAVTLPEAVMIGEGEQSATINLQTNASPVTATISAAANGYETVTSTVTITPRPVFNLTAAASRLGIPNPVSVELSISDTAPAGGLVVPLSVEPTGILDVPADVTIPAGSSSISFTANGLAYGSAVLSAAQSPYVSDSVHLTVEPVYIEFEPGNPLVAPGLSRTFNVSLTKPAPEGGTTVALTVDDPSRLTLPASVQIAAGETDAEVLLSGVSQGSAQVSGAAAGYEPESGLFYVKDVDLYTDSTPVLVPIGQTANTTLRVYPYAGVAFAVGVASSDPSIFTTDRASVPFSSFQTSSSVLQLTGHAEGTAELALTSPGLRSRTFPVEVGVPYLVFSRQTMVVGHQLRSGLLVERRIRDQPYYAATALTVVLSSSDASKIGLPESITISTGNASAWFELEGLALTTEPIEIQAAAEDYVSPQSPLLVSVVAPVLTFDDLEGSRLVGDEPDRFQVRLRVPGAQDTNQEATADLTVGLALVDPSPVGVVAGIEDDEGNPVSEVIIALGDNGSGWSDSHVASPTAVGSYVLEASLPGIGAWTSETQQVLGGWIEFEGNTGDSRYMVLGHGLQDRVRLRLRDGSNAVEPISIALTSSMPAAVQVPASVVIPAGENFVEFQVQGLAATAEPVRIALAAEGYALSTNGWSEYPEDGIYANVVEPVLRFEELDGRRDVGDGNDDFHIWWDVPMPQQSGGARAVSNSKLQGDVQTATADQVFEVSVIGWPPGIVTGIQDNLGNPTTQIRIAAGENDSYASFDQQNHQVTTPTTTGGYRVEATLPGVGQWASESQVVGDPALAFDPDEIRIAAGLEPAEVWVSQWGGPARAVGSDKASLEALEIQLSCISEAVCMVPESVTIPDGEYGVSFPLTAVGTGSSYVLLQADGYPGKGQLRVVVVNAGLGLEPPWEYPFHDWFAGMDMDVWISLVAPAQEDCCGEQGANAAQQIIVNLVSSDPSVVSVPAQIVIEQGEEGVDAVFTAVGPGTATVTASGALLETTVQTITVKP